MTDGYTDADLQRILSEDPAVAELGIDVSVRGDHVLLTGQVESPDRRAEIERRVAGYLPGERILNEITVAATHPPAGAEELT
jgi:osmotically-inducible protein OsmY